MRLRGGWGGLDPGPANAWLNLDRGRPLQDHDNTHVNLWGLYGSYDLPKLGLALGDARASLDLFYLGWRATPFAGARRCRRSR